MKKTIALLLVMYLYLIVPVGFVSWADGDADGYLIQLLAILGIGLILILVVGILNIRSAVTLFRGGNYNVLRSEMKRVKMGSIPFFLAEFVILIAIAMGTLMAVMFFFWTIGGPIAFMVVLALDAFILYMIMLIGSSYSIAFISLLKKEGAISTGVSVFLIILQFIPLADIVVTLILLMNHEKRMMNH